MVLILRLCDKGRADYCRGYGCLRRCGYSEAHWCFVGNGLARSVSSDNCQHWIIRILLTACNIFYMTKIIILPLVLADGASPVPTVYQREIINLKLRTLKEASFSPNSQYTSANLNSRTFQKAHLRKNEIVELCEAFHCERCFPELQSPQNLMPMLPLSEALPSLNAPTSDKMVLPHLSRRLEFMDADFGTTSKLL